jgi:glycosyltransferase involved in cell wall biosynthesis
VVKNAGKHISEWIAYQLALGFDAVILLDNGSSDDTRAVAEAFIRHYDVRVIDWNMHGIFYQRRGYEHAVWAFRREFAWCACIDADEFLVLPRDRPLARLVDVANDVGAIAMPWAMFGSSGHIAPPSDLVINSYLYRSPASFPPNRHIKSLVRSEMMMSCKNCHVFEVDGHYVDMSHAQIPQPTGVLTSDPEFAFGKLHHYFVKSRQDWAEKMARGYHDTTRPSDHFVLHDRNDEYDPSAMLLANRVTEIMLSL